MKYILMTSFLLLGCAGTPQRGNNCCQRLDVRTKEMSEYNRYCMMLVFAGRKETNKKVLEDITDRLNLCKFVFNVPTNNSLISKAEKEKLKRAHHYEPIRSGAWDPPMGCDPHEIHCEEF